MHLSISSGKVNLCFDALLYDPLHILNGVETGEEGGLLHSKMPKSHFTSINSHLVLCHGTWLLTNRLSEDGEYLG